EEGGEGGGLVRRGQARGGGAPPTTPPHPKLHNSAESAVQWQRKAPPEMSGASKIAAPSAMVRNTQEGVQGLLTHRVEIGSREKPRREGMGQNRSSAPLGETRGSVSMHTTRSGCKVRLQGRVARSGCNGTTQVEHSRFRMR